MKTKLIVAAAILGFAAVTLQGADANTQAEFVGPESQVLKRHAVDWNDPEWWQAMQKKDTSMQIGRSDYVVEGPVFRSFRRPRNWSERTLGEKISSLPIVSLFVPQPMPVEQRSIRDLRATDYFRWGNHDQPWANIADRPLGGPGLIAVSY